MLRSDSPVKQRIEHDEFWELWRFVNSLSEISSKVWLFIDECSGLNYAGKKKFVQTFLKTFNERFMDAVFFPLFLQK